MIRNNIVHILNNLLSVFDIKSLIKHGGLLIVFLLVYGSSGLFFCFFIPVGAVLFTAGILTATGNLHYDILTICGLLVFASVLGCLTGYWFGWKTGPLLYKRQDSRFFKKRHLTTAESFYKKYGWMALTLGLFLPIIRTFVSIIAGIIKLDFHRFIALVTIGSLFSTLSFLLLGYLIGTVPALKSSLSYTIPIFVLIVTIPLIFWIIKELKKLRKANIEKTQD